MVCVLVACHRYGVCAVGCVVCDCMVCVLVACHRYGVCTVGCVVCDCMLCVLAECHKYGIVYYWLFWVGLYCVCIGSMSLV